MDILIFSWWVGAAGAILSVGGGIYYMLSLNILRGEIRSSMIFMFLGSSIWVVYSIIMIIFVFKGINITDIKWMIIPLAYTLTSILFIIGTAKLMKILKTIQLKETEKLKA